MVELNPLKGVRQSKESDKAVIACNDWLRLGPGRTMPELIAKYKKTPKNSNPTQSPGTLYKWSEDFDWSSRATEYDAGWESEKNRQREEVMQRGLALDYERVSRLMRLAEWLEGQIYEQGEKGVFHNVWLPDVKQIGSGDNSERVDLEKFNAPILGEFRGVLDDLAKETGGRKIKTEHTGEVSLGVMRLPNVEQKDTWEQQAKAIKPPKSE